MKLSGRLVVAAAMLSTAANVFAFHEPDRSRLPNIDNRLNVAPDESIVPGSREAGVVELRTRVPKLQVQFHPITRAPKLLLNRDGFLTGPNGSGATISKANLVAIAAQDPDRITKAFVREHKQVFGHGAEALDQARIKREFVTPHNGMRTVVWEQHVDGVPVFEAIFTSHTTAQGELVNIASQFIPNPRQAAQKTAANPKAGRPAISARQAVAIAASNVGEPGDPGLLNSLGASVDPASKESFNGPHVLGNAEASLTWLPMDEQTLRLCWEIVLTSRIRGEMFRVLVDAETGAMQLRHCLTDYLTDATYRVFTSDSPSPLSPGYSTPVSTQPPLISRSLVTWPALNTNASPLGWLNDGANETLGNNVDAHTDTNNDDIADLPRPQGSPSRVFDFSMDLTTQNPSAYKQAAVVQLFYWNNWMHDKLYELGFTEAAGNFQSNNFARGGLGNDAVQADAQDGGGFNNANFSTPSDGSPGRMQMYIFSGPTPQRDGDLDAEIVLHEYTHGLSNRRVGGGVGISALQPSGMGEGWSDFYGISLLSEAGDDVNGVYAAGAYATYQLSGMTQNYYYGIRRYPYCTDMTKNPLTFKDIDPSQASAHSGVPRSSIIGTTADEVHNMGEVWCVTLWEARANLINKYGWAVGNQRILQLVTDGMNLSPANPNFLQARDAIIQADLVDFGGANRPQLWAAFARRGMGLSASSPSSSSTAGLVEAYDLPDNLQITPAVLSVTGPVGGPFTPNPATFTLANSGTNSLSWSLSSASAWFSISPTSGILAGGATSNLSVLVSGVATNFPLGATNASVWFTNLTSGIAQSRTFSVSVVGRSLFENFEPDIHLSLWSGFGGSLGSTVIATNYGGSISGVNSLWFGDGGTRSATTIPVNTTAGGSLSFYLRLGNGSFPWETVDIPGEGIVLEYSTNSGSTWTITGTYDTSTFYSWTQVTTNIPAGALSASTQFRWRQLSHSGTCCDHWALDDISIDAGPTPPSILSQPVSQTVKSGTNVILAVSAQGSFPLSYQWRKDGTNLLTSGRIPSVTNATLTISTVLESDSGQYSVVVTNLYGTAVSAAAALNVTPLDHFNWSAIPSPQAVGSPFTATITAKDFLNATVTNFNGSAGVTANSGGGSATNTILGNLTYQSTGSGLYTLGFAFTPNTNLLVTHWRTYSGTKVSLWQTNGQLLASQNVVSVPGSWVETPLTSPVTLSAGTTYVVSFYTADSTYYMRSDLTNSFPNGSIPALYYYVSGDGYPSNISVSQTVFLVDLRYTVNSGLPITITPTSAGPFTNGVWSGLLTAQSPGSNVVLRAQEAGGHSGLSNPFDVLLQNDVSINITDFPDPVAVGANLTYVLSVANAGPATATAVVVTNLLPPGVTFVSASSSQGTCTRTGSIVRCDLGTLAAATNATATIVVVPTSAGTFTNVATVSRGETDPYLANNTATAVTAAQVPAITVSDFTLLEGNFGVTNATFTVSLSLTGALPVSVNYATADGTALAGSDYVATNGTVSFAPGQTNAFVLVGIKGDTLGEATESFFLNLSAPTNATILDGQGVCTILNDDVPPAAYVRSTAGAPWGSTSNEAAMSRVFGSSNWQDLRYETLIPGALFTGATRCIFMEGSDVDATEMEAFLGTNIVAIQNWVSNGGSLFLNSAPNEDNGMSFGFGITLVYQDSTGTGLAALPTHQIFNGPFSPVGSSWTGNSFGHATVTGAGLTTLITNSLNGHIVLGEKSFGVGHVLFGGMTTDNFHSPQPEAANLRANILAYLDSLSSYHFEWNTIASPRQFNQPIPITITARDVTNGVFTGFNGTVVFTALTNGSNSAPVVPGISGTFSNGVWSGTITVQQPGPNVVLLANDGNGHTGSSNPFEVVAPNDLILTMDDSPDPVSAGASLTYSLRITNTGPSTATAVTVTNALPPGVTFLSAISSQGTCARSGSTVSCVLGTVPTATNAVITIVVSPTTAGTLLTNTATVFRGEADAYLPNNSAQVTTLVTTPAISIGDGPVLESDAATTSLLLSVTLAAPSAQTITVDYATISGTATAGIDYFATNGTLSFPPGTTNLPVRVTVVGDKIIEPDETVVIALSNPQNGVLGRSQATGTILNDDGLPGYVDHFNWNAVASPQAAGVPFGAVITAKDYFNSTVTNFNGAAALSALGGGGAVTNTILASPSYTSVSSGSFTLGFSFTPNTNLTVTHVRHYSGTKVSIWTDAGTLIAAQNVVSTPGVWLETPLLSPVQLLAGNTYRVAAYSAGGNYYWRSDMGGTFSNGIINASCEGSGDVFPSTIDSSRWWFVDLRYGANGGGLFPVTPTVTGSFSNGVWSGNVAVQQLATNVTLAADDGAGHTGASNPFDLVLQNDLSLAMTAAPDPVSVGASLTYTVNITNTGPNSSTGVVLTNLLPASASFLSATLSQGTYTQAANVVVCNLGVIPGATNATVSLTVVPNSAGIVLTNMATVTRVETEPYTSNNIATTLTTVTLPAVSIADAGVREGNVGGTNAAFVLSLTAPSAQTITASYITASGTALSGADFTATNGVVTFLPGVTNATVLVRVLGDIAVEANETFFVTISSPVNAIIARSQATGTITNDDGFAGQIDHFVWQTIGSPQITNAPFAVGVTALDFSNVVVTNFTGLVTLSALQPGGGLPLTPTVSGPFTNGTWGGMLAVQTFGTNVSLRADDGDGHLGNSNPFHVLATNQPPLVLKSPSNTVAYLGGAASMQVAVFGTEPLRYQWRLNGVDLPGQTNSAVTLNRASFADGGSYSVVVWNFFGTNTSAKAVLGIQQIATWGAGTNGNAASFNYNQAAVPFAVTNSGRLSGGQYHSLLSRTDGSVSAWGATATNLQGGINYGQTNVPPVGNIVAVAAGGYHSVALRSDGTVAAWGAGSSNLFSLPQWGQSVVPPLASNVIAIAAGDYHSVALRNDGRVLAWGYGGSGQTNVPVAATSNVVAIASRGSHVLALRSDGLFVHWGSLTTLPVGVSNVVAIAAGVNHCLALKSDGTVVSWGSQTTVPVGLSNVVDIAAGSDHNLALRSDGSIVTWGATNLYGRYLIPPGLSNFVAVACGYYHSLAVLGDGSPLIKWQPLPATVLLGSPASFYVMAVGPQLSYQWRLNGSAIPSATNSNYLIQSAQPVNAGNYQVIVTSTYSSVTSSVASLNVLAPIGTAVEAPGLTWSASGNASWFGQTTNTHDGVDAAQSGRVADGQTSTVQTTVSGPGVLNFWWKVSSEQYFDFLNFFIDQTQQTGVSGEVDWQLQTFAVASGVHTLRWTYQKDSSVSAGLDAGWLDQVQYTTNPPVLTAQPSGQTNSMGATFTLAASASGATPITWQWLKSGTNLPGATLSFLTIPNATRHDSAAYSVMASNPGGGTPSSNATVLIRVPQKLTSALQPNGTFLLTSTDADGGLLTPADIGNLQLQVSSNLVNWIASPTTLSSPMAC